MNTKTYGFAIPWYMFDLANYNLITSRTIPEEISDTKKPRLTEQGVPGLNYDPVISGGNHNRHLAFRIDLVSRDQLIGVTPLIKSLEMLRNQTQNLWTMGKSDFNPNPKVLYCWGVGSIPMVCLVARVDFTHVSRMTGSAMQPTYSHCDIELIVDESNPLHKMEEMWRMASSILGMAQGLVQVGWNSKLPGRPY